MAYVSGVEVKVDQVAVRPREPPRPSPHVAVNSPEMATRMIRPRNSSPAQPGLASRYIQRITQAKGRQATLEKVYGQMGAELVKVDACFKSAPDAATRAACDKRRMALQKARAVTLTQIKQAASDANASAIDAIKNGASKTEVVNAAKAVEATSASTPVVESSTMQVTPAGDVIPGPDATIVATPVVTDPSKVDPVSVIPGANANVNAAVAQANGIPWGKIAVVGVGLFALSRMLRR